MSVDIGASSFQRHYYPLLQKRKIKETFSAIFPTKKPAKQWPVEI
ncbi:hypothetical protein DB29_03026 [Shouchella clausii]|nr:hypothetical protein DB29_03026 [Shouchella clausii]